MKKIDKLLLTSFAGPFAVSFGIALFVLIMQFLWLYIDDIAGKGVSVFILLELIGYLSISTFPMALPIAILIASVMVMGNLAERYELSSMKSAGVPLVRVMRVLIVCSVLTGLFSYVCSDFLIPVSNLKFKTRLFDIRKQKPALGLEKGIFNEDFRQFVIRIGDKEPDGETISDVMIEQLAQTSQLKFSQILADSGQMYSSPDQRFFVMNLFDGYQYQEPGQAGGRQQQKYPFIRTKFRTWKKVWDLKEFDMNPTDEENFRQQRSMLTMSQLRRNIDSLDRAMVETRQGLAQELASNLKKEPSKPRDPASRRQSRPDTAAAPPAPPPASPVAQAIRNTPPPTPPRPQLNLPRQVLARPLTQYASFDETFRPEDRTKLYRDATNRVKNMQTALNSRKEDLAKRLKEQVKTGFELYSKYSFALVCVIFLFIGAPMGAIIRKGGFGYPILVSITFFVMFIFLVILCKKLAESYVMTPFWAAMTPCLVLAPVGAFLTIRAMNDSQMINTDRLELLLTRLRNRFRRNKKTATA
jgi:lipopolysaccharide export system permease protein